MHQQLPKDDEEFDIILVGAGPSAAGLLYGILHRIHLDRVSAKDDANNNVSGNQSSNLSQLRIAILERGDGADVTACSDEATTTDNDDGGMNTASSSLLFEHHHSSTKSLSNWFQSAHYNIPSSKTTKHPTLLHTTLPQPHLSNRIVDVPTGMGWGGGSNINAGLVMQPLKDDFIHWPGRWRGGSLIQSSMGEILTVMKENGGLTELLCSDHLLLQREKAKEEDGGRRKGAPFLAQPTLVSTRNNRRVNYFTSLIAPLLQRHPELHSNVTFLSGVQVERILIRYPCSDGDDSSSTQHPCCNPQAWGVECDNGIYRRIIRSKRDIIICSGAIATPALLLASGIGTEDDLKTAGIAPWYEDVKCDMHNAHIERVHRNLLVGHNLRDHILLPQIFLSPRLFFNAGAESFNSIIGCWMMGSTSWPDAKVQLQLADGTQMDYMIPHFAAGSLRRRWVLPFAIQLPLSWMQSCFLQGRAVMRLFFCIPVLSKWVKMCFASLNHCLLNPKSVGRVTVKTMKERKSSTRLSDCKVIIDPNYLSDPWDVESLWRGWASSSTIKLQLFSKSGIESLSEYAFSIILALISYAVHWMNGGRLQHDDHGHELRGKVPQWFRKYAAEFSNSYYHWCGTCAMGSEEDVNAATVSNGDSVVDEQLRVRGLGNLRICDASVFPDTVSAPPAFDLCSVGSRCFVIYL